MVEGEVLHAFSLVKPRGQRATTSKVDMKVCVLTKGALDRADPLAELPRLVLEGLICAQTSGEALSYKYGDNTSMKTAHNTSMETPLVEQRQPVSRPADASPRHYTSSFMLVCNVLTCLQHAEGSVKPKEVWLWTTHQPLVARVLCPPQGTTSSYFSKHASNMAPCLCPLFLLLLHVSCPLLSSSLPPPSPS